MIARLIPNCGERASSPPGLYRLSPLACLVLLALAGCGSSAPPAPVAPHDPVMSAALQAPLLVDPDLSQQNARNLAIVPPGPVPVSPASVSGANPQ